MLSDEFRSLKYFGSYPDASPPVDYPCTSGTLKGSVSILKATAMNHSMNPECNWVIVTVLLNVFTFGHSDEHDYITSIKCLHLICVGLTQLHSYVTHIYYM